MNIMKVILFFPLWLRWPAITGTMKIVHYKNELALRALWLKFTIESTWFANPSITDNTNIDKRMLYNYVSIAHDARYCVVVVEPRTSWKYSVTDCAVKNHHNVTVDILSETTLKVSANKCLLLWMVSFRGELQDFKRQHA